MRCFAGTFDDAVECVIDRVLSHLGGYAVLCNVHVLMTAQERLDVHGAVDDAWAVFPDGAPVAWLQRRLGAHAAERVGGPDLMRGVLDRGRARGLRHVLVGSTDPTLQRLGDRLRAQLRGVEIVGTLAPPYGDASLWSDEAIAKIRAWRPDIIWLALGAPKQEMWMRQYASAVAPALVIGVGAAFDFHAETKKRAPRLDAARRARVGSSARCRADAARWPLSEDQHGVSPAVTGETVRELHVQSRCPRDGEGTG